MTLSFEEAFQTYIRSGFPLIVIPTREVDRATNLVFELTKKWNKTLAGRKMSADKERLKVEGYQMFKWDCINGWKNAMDPKQTFMDTGTTPHAGLKWLIGEQPHEGVYVMQNAHMFFNEAYTLPELIQFFREHYDIGRTENRHLFLIGDLTELPSELQPLAVVIDFPLPNRDELYTFIHDQVEDLGYKIPEETIRKAADAATGMTTHEVESAVCVAIVRSKGRDIDKEIVFAEKAKAVKRSGLLEHIPTDFNIDKHIGGLENFKGWLHKVAAAFKDAEGAREYGLPMPKGCLIAGVSGTGKSAAAKATANLFGVPLFRLDIGRVFGHYVGETERKTRQVTQLMEAVAPCVVLFDEIEKSGMGGSSGLTDNGVSDRVTQTLLYWLQEKTAAVYIMATANEVGKLPPEMLRKGRFDELWFVDLPSQIEREQILRIHIERTGRNISAFKGFEKLAGTPTVGYTGAELEAVVKQAMFDAFSAKGGRREFTIKDIESAISQTVPLIKTKHAEIEALRAWASNKARQANVGEVVQVSSIPEKKRGIFVDPVDLPQALASKRRNPANG